MDRPRPSTEHVRRKMQVQRRVDTEPEVAVRRALHRKGLRYRLQARVLPSLGRRVDIAFAPARVAVDVRGCFWHGCPEHATYPKANADWWQKKLAVNRQRDADTEARLRAAGWLLIIVWEHEDAEEAATRIASVVAERRHTIKQQPNQR